MKEEHKGRTPFCPAKNYNAAWWRQEKADQRQLKGRTYRELGIFWISLDSRINSGDDEGTVYLDLVSDGSVSQEEMFDEIERNEKCKPYEWETLLALEVEELSNRELILWNALLQSPDNFQQAARIAQVSFNVMTTFIQLLRRRLAHVYEALKKLHGWH